MLKITKIAATAAGISISYCGAAIAQTQLPDIVVTTPSPIAAKPALEQAPGPTAPISPPSKKQASPAPNVAPPPKVVAPIVPTPALPAGISLSIAADPTFSATTVIGQRELVAQSAPTVGDALATQPGIASTGFAPGASRPVIRGLGGFRVSVQENGLGTGDVQKLSDDHAVPIDPLAAERIEVVRGPAALRFGSQALGGVVNATNSRIPEAIPQGGFRAMTSGGFNSVNGGREGSGMVEAGAGNFVIHADTFARSAGDYRIPGGRQANTGFDSSGYSLGGSYVVNQGYFGLAYSSFASTYFIPGSEAAARRNHIVLDQTKLTGKGEWRVRDYGIEAIRYWFSALDYKHDEVDGLGSDAIVGSTFLNKQMEARAEVQHKAVATGLGELRGAAGLQWGDRKLSAAGGDGVLLDPTKTRTLAGYVFEELQLTQRLKLQAAARIEQANVRGTASTFPTGLLPPPDDPDQTPANRTFTPKSGSFGLLYSLPLGIVARGTLQHTERAPDATELFYKGPHDATQTFEIGDPALKIEQANTIEFGLKRARGQFRFDASAYHTQFKDFIYKRFTGVKCDGDFASCGAGSELDQIAYAQRNASFYGAEVQTEFDIAPIWHGMWGIEGRYDFVHATFEDKTFVPKITPHRLGGGLFYRDTNWLARVSLLHAFGQNRIASFETPTAGYNLLNAEVSYTMKLDPLAGIARDFVIGIKAENLLDADIRNHVSYKKDEVLQPGRSVRVFGTLKLN